MRSPKLRSGRSPKLRSLPRSERSGRSLRSNFLSPNFLSPNFLSPNFLSPNFFSANLSPNFLPMGLSNLRSNLGSDDESLRFSNGLSKGLSKFFSGRRSAYLSDLPAYPEYLEESDRLSERLSKFLSVFLSDDL